MNVEDQIKFGYVLTEESVVYDVGAHKGGWSRRLIEICGCVPKISAFEPVKTFYSLLYPFPGQAFNFGLGAKTRMEYFFSEMAPEGTGMYGIGKPFCVDIRAAAEVIQEPQIDLMMVNIEGGEYELLRHLITTGLIDRIMNLVVQFHAVVLGWDDLRRDIREGLRATHDRPYSTRAADVYHAEFSWDVWRRR